MNIWKKRWKLPNMSKKEGKTPQVMGRFDTTVDGLKKVKEILLSTFLNEYNKLKIRRTKQCGKPNFLWNVRRRKPKSGKY